MSTDIAIRPPTTLDTTILEEVIIGGDLERLSPQQRVAYYLQVCASVGLNPLTQPFAYIRLNNKLTLYAKKDCAEQLRGLHHVSVGKPEITFAEGLCVVVVTASTPDGRTDGEIGAVPIDGLKGEARANALLKAVTKAKRRVTLSICGLGMLDETEVDAVPEGRVVDVDPETGELRGEWETGRRVEAPPVPPARPAPAPPGPRAAPDITSAEDPKWRTWEELRDRARGLKVPIPTMTLPAYGAALTAATRALTATVEAQQIKNQVEAEAEALQL